MACHINAIYKSQCTCCVSILCVVPKKASQHSLKLDEVTYTAKELGWHANYFMAKVNMEKLMDQDGILSISTVQKYIPPIRKEELRDCQQPRVYIQYHS